MTKTSIFLIRDLEFLLWKWNGASEKDETRSEVNEARVWTRATSVRSTAARNASRDGDLRRRKDEKMEVFVIFKNDDLGVFLSCVFFKNVIYEDG